jgi:hypothetical protein
MLNSLFVRRSRERLAVPRGFVAASRPEAGLAPELVEREQAVVLFDGPHDVLRWEVRTRHRDVAVERWVYGRTAEAPPSKQAAEGVTPTGSELYVILAIRRGAAVMPMHADLEPREGDVASVAVYIAETEAAHLALERSGWSPQADDANEDG